MPFATTPKTDFEKIRAQYIPEAPERIAVDLKTCCEAKLDKPPLAVLNPFQLVGSSVEAPILSQSSMFEFPICCWANNVESEKAIKQKVRVFFIVFNLRYKH